MVGSLMEEPRARRSGSRRSLRPGLRRWSWSRRSVDVEPPAAVAAYDACAQRLRLLAELLTDVPERAEGLVVDAILAHVGPYVLPDLAAEMYRAWRRGGYLPGPPSSGTLTSSAVVRHVHRMPADQRAALGLCKFGGHDYRRAAGVLGLDPGHVARLLSEALRSLTETLTVEVARPQP